MASITPPPVLLAIIPQPCGRALADHVAGHPLVLPAQHGWEHRNHAPVGEKPQELGLHRGLPAVLDDLACGRAKLTELFGPTLRPVLVPPWNRIAPEIVPHLPALGFAGLSTFGQTAATQGLPSRFDCHVDIIDWKGTRSGHPPARSAAKLAEALARARMAGHAPVGILTHHLVHGANATAFLDGLGALVARHSAACWVSYDELTIPEPKQ